MVKHVIDTAHQLGAENIHLIYGHGGDVMRTHLANEQVNWVLQTEQSWHSTCSSTSGTFL